MEETTELEFPFGVDISGYVRPEDGSEPEPGTAVLCPLCASGRAPKRRRYWRELALGGGGRPIDDNLEYKSLCQYGTRCEACGKLASEWDVQGME